MVKCEKKNQIQNSIVYNNSCASCLCGQLVFGNNSFFLSFQETWIEAHAKRWMTKLLYLTLRHWDYFLSECMVYFAQLSTESYQYTN